MTDSPVVTPSPGSIDTPAQITDLRANSDHSFELHTGSNVITLEPYSPSIGRQSSHSGGVNENMRVLYCTGIDGNNNYKSVYECMKTYGSISRIKLKLCSDEQTYDGYVTFNEALSAKNAYENFSKSTSINVKGKIALQDIWNVVATHY